jgi:hypothetical protein
VRPSFVTILLLFVTAVPASATEHESVVDLTFPVAGPVSFSAGYDDCRSGCSRRHQATDLMGAYGLAVHAAMGGTVRYAAGHDGSPPSWGYAVSIVGTDGRTYNYIHLGRQDGPPSEAIAPGVVPGASVERGQLIGFLGCSGNASCSAPHLHFEIEDPAVTGPYGTSRLDPYPSLVDAQRRGDVPAEFRGFVPVAGDWNGDGVATPGYFRDGDWVLFDSFDASGPARRLRYGQAGDVPVVGDWDGDGVDTVGIVRGNLWVLRSVYRRGAEDVVLRYGEPGDAKVVGDWDGDGVDTIGIVRGNLWVLRSVYRRGADDVVLAYGQPGDIPVVGDWDGNGTDTLGVIRGDTWILRNVYKRSARDVVLRMRLDQASAVVADWGGSGRSGPGVVRSGVWTRRTSVASSAELSDVVR